MTDQELVDRAIKMQEFSYVPYSRFPVGAALLCDDGTVFTNGGRVLGVTGLGETLPQALEKAYGAVREITFKNAHYRTDIGKK